jgi:threonine synthase
MGALDQLLANGVIRPSERVLVFNTGGAMKYPDLIEEPIRRLDLGQAPDWQAVTEG